ncbi:hypothetical protein AX16_002944 [Volvariella volvacea WC 439]|nr:hypothetical protein AX16_002944 [Volvariella volvacea WC 439]
MTALWQETPLIHSNLLSEKLGASVYLKLENLHPSYSFKYRGISHFVQRAKQDHGPDVHMVIASGGNAGLAAACAARVLGVRCTVFLPEWTTETTRALLKQEKAELRVKGKVYAEAVRAAQDFIDEEPNARIMVPAYDHPTIWEGHGSMIEEISKQLPQKPDAVLCSVGGGGLLGGIIVGCQKVGWGDVPLVALETIGSDCFYHSMSMNGGRFNHLEKKLPLGVGLVHDPDTNLYMSHFSQFTSKASGSLGAPQPSPGVMTMAIERVGDVRCVSVPDELSMQAAVQFADDHKLLVELACSTTLVPAYKSALFNYLVPPKEGKERVVVFIVCGGFKISVSDIEEYRKLVERNIQEGGTTWGVLCDDGTVFPVDK